MIYIFVLNGSPRSGKDTLTDFFSEYGFVYHFSYVDAVRDMLKSIHIDFSHKTDRDRQLMESICNALEKYDDVPMKLLCSNVRYTMDVESWRNLSNFNDAFIFVDIRKPDNIKRFKKEFPEIMTLYVEDGKGTNNVTESDASVRDYEYDYYIANTGTLTEFEATVNKFIRENFRLTRTHSC